MDKHRSPEAQRDLRHQSSSPHPSPRAMAGLWLGNWEKGQDSNQHKPDTAWPFPCATLKRLMRLERKARVEDVSAIEQDKAALVNFE